MVGQRRQRRRGRQVFVVGVPVATMLANALSVGDFDRVAERGGISAQLKTGLRRAPVAFRRILVRARHRVVREAITHVEQPWTTVFDFVISCTALPGPDTCQWPQSGLVPRVGVGVAPDSPAPSRWPAMTGTAEGERVERRRAQGDRAIASGRRRHRDLRRH